MSYTDRIKKEQEHVDRVMVPVKAPFFLGILFGIVLALTFLWCAYQCI